MHREDALLHRLEGVPLGERLGRARELVLTVSRSGPASGVQHAAGHNDHVGGRLREGSRDPQLETLATDVGAQLEIGPGPDDARDGARYRRVRGLHGHLEHVHGLAEDGRGPVDLPIEVHAEGCAGRPAIEGVDGDERVRLVELVVDGQVEGPVLRVHEQQVVGDRDVRLTDAEDGNGG